MSALLLGRQNRREAANRQRSDNEDLTSKCDSLQQALAESEAHIQRLQRAPNPLSTPPAGPSTGLEVPLL